MTKGDREMIVTTTSAANKCLYCMAALSNMLPNPEFYLMGRVPKVN